MPLRPRVTMRTHDVFSIAHDLAARLGHRDVSPVHLLLAVIREGRSPAIVVLYNRGVHLDALKEELESQLPSRGVPYISDHRWTEGDLAILQNATREASELGHEYQGCEHVLLAVLRDSESVASRTLARHDVHFDDARAEVLNILGSPQIPGTDRASPTI